MNSSELNSVFLQAAFHRIQAGDLTVREELISRAQDRLSRLTRKMLRGFPNVHRWEDTGDVMQQASLRLLRSLESVQPKTQREFFGLAAEQIRRVLIDLARRYQGPLGIGANHASVNYAPPAAFDPASPDASRSSLDRWAAFHEAIGKLPELEREVMSLVFYDGWQQAEIAERLNISERTVRRRWQAACLQLSDLLHGEIPTL